jgi:hypothetical protein
MPPVAVIGPAAPSCAKRAGELIPVASANKAGPASVLRLLVRMILLLFGIEANGSQQPRPFAGGGGEFVVGRVAERDAVAAEGLLGIAFEQVVVAELAKLVELRLLGRRLDRGSRREDRLVDLGNGRCDNVLIEWLSLRLL